MSTVAEPRGSAEHGNPCERPCVPPRRLDSAAEHCMSEKPVSCWVTLGMPTMACFHAVVGETAPTVPRFSRVGLILSCLVSSTECLRQSSLSRPFGATRPAWVWTLFATSPAASTSTGAHPLPLRSALRVLHPPDGLLRLRLRGLVASRCHVQGFLRSGVSPDPQPTRLFAGRCPLAVGVRLLTGAPAATAKNLGFGALLRESKRAPESVFSLL